MLGCSPLVRSRTAIGETGDDRPPQSYSPVTATAISIAAIEEYGHEKLKADTQARALRARALMVVGLPVPAFPATPTQPAKHCGPCTTRVAFQHPIPRFTAA